MGAGHADALGMGTADVAQHDAALNGFDAAGAGSLQLGVIVMDGGAVDAFEQLGVIHTKNHNSGHLKNYPLP